MKKVVKIEKYISCRSTQISFLLVENGKFECLNLDAYDDEAIFAYAVHTQPGDDIYFEKDDGDYVVLFKNITQQFEVSDYEEEEPQDGSNSLTNDKQDCKSEGFLGMSFTGWLLIAGALFIALYFCFLGFIR